MVDHDGGIRPLPVVNGHSVPPQPETGKATASPESRPPGIIEIELRSGIKVRVDAASTRRRCGGCWRWSGKWHDATGPRHAGVAGVPPDGHAQRIRRPGGAGEERAVGRSVFGASVVFRGKRGDYIKVLYWDGSGLCLFAKRLEKGRFVWPPIIDERLHLTPANWRC